MKLSFVIPAYNEEGYIEKCLDSVCAQAQKHPGLVEIIVVNNASTDRTGEIAATYPGVRVVEEPHKGLVWARRAGYLVSSGDLIANVDSDTVLTPGWLDTVFKEFIKNPKLVGLSGPFKCYDLPKRTRQLINIFYGMAQVVYLFNNFVLRKGSMLQGGNFIVTRTGLEKIGGYDTSIEFYGEDTNIARRLYEVGNVKFTPRLPMYASGRRVAAEGMLNVGIKSARNYFWMTFFKKPKDNEHIDHRPKNFNQSVRQSGRFERGVGTNLISERESKTRIGWKGLAIRFTVVATFFTLIFGSTGARAQNSEAIEQKIQTIAHTVVSESKVNYNKVRTKIDSKFNQDEN